MNNDKLNMGSQAATNGENQVSKEEQAKKERMIPIFEDYEEKENGKAVHKWMLSLNGMYISGITDQQMSMMALELVKLCGAELKKSLHDAALTLDAMEKSRKNG